MGINLKSSGNISDIFKKLKGKWCVDRTIDPGGVFQGDAVFNVLSDTEYEYTETGEMTFDNGHKVEAYRSYIYRLEEEAIAVYFNDGQSRGQLFHRIEIDASGEATTEHLCLQDLYKTKYKFDLPDQFTIQHDVKGPKKDYRSLSVFSS